MSTGDAAQTRMIAEQVADAALTRFRDQHPEIGQRPIAEIPAPLKWAGGIVAALLAMAAGGTMTWLVSTTNETQMAVGRIEERIKSLGEVQGGRFIDMERRVSRLESLQERDER
jgi:hypothetical protein